ncbi:hypothetical protein HJ01_01100 [Flavobacterium frigoris PS1]|uniref:Uncharacterized protein n=1 Tax=Flavobacterium frigoris (strain PS1) TaxID=1086011 RepID=H7FPK2_FLAFP|nr:hypothetical protein HJ01_01100 [Flavobacterium frigoris PS1]
MNRTESTYNQIYCQELNFQKKHQMYFALFMNYDSFIPAHLIVYYINFFYVAKSKS